ncbi:DUF3820 family protein [Eionea flava]
MDQPSVLTPENLYALVTETMPFGKYQGFLLADLPEEYLLWFDKQGFPTGKLGEWLQLALVLHIDGSRAVLKPLREKYSPNHSPQYSTQTPKKRIQFD